MSTPADGERVSRDLLDRLAPSSVNRLVDEGLPPPPVPMIVKRPPFRRRGEEDRRRAGAGTKECHAAAQKSFQVISGHSRLNRFPLFRIYFQSAVKAPQIHDLPGFELKAMVG